MQLPECFEDLNFTDGVARYFVKVVIGGAIRVVAFTVQEAGGCYRFSSAVNCIIGGGSVEESHLSGGEVSALLRALAGRLRGYDIVAVEQD